MENKTSSKRLGIIDVAIILILVVSILGLAMRFILVKDSPKDDVFYALPTEKYLVSFMIRDKRPEYFNCLESEEQAGESFRFSTTNKDFGILNKVSNRPAEKWYSYEGQSYLVENEGEGYEERVDISGSFIVEGKMNEEGLLAVNSSDGSTTTVSLFSSVGLRSDRILFTATITAIEPYNAAG